MWETPEAPDDVAVPLGGAKALDVPVRTEQRHTALLIRQRFAVHERHVEKDSFVHRHGAVVAAGEHLARRREGSLIGLPIHFTPRGLRRTFNDLARAANVEALVTKSISGHQTDRMREHYSTVQPLEQRQSIGAVLRLVKGGGRRVSTLAGVLTGVLRPRQVYFFEV